MLLSRWAEAPIKIARMTLTIKLDGNWSSFQRAWTYLWFFWTKSRFFSNWTYLGFFGLIRGFFFEREHRQTYFGFFFVFLTPFASFRYFRLLAACGATKTENIGRLILGFFIFLKIFAFASCFRLSAACGATKTGVNRRLLSRGRCNLRRPGDNSFRDWQLSPDTAVNVQKSASVQLQLAALRRQFILGLAILARCCCGNRCKRPKKCACASCAFS